MAPIRTAIIGLSSSSPGNWARHAHLPYLLSPEGKAKFQIVALCNSSVDAAKSAIEFFELPPETRAYGDPEALAADPDVQLVVCATRVDKHYETILPSVRQGKSAYVEWPLAQNAALADELAALAREKGGKTMVGLQGWYAPAVVKIRELVRSGRIGKVLSSEVRGAGGTVDRIMLPPFLKYFADRKVGGNPFTIGFGHRKFFHPYERHSHIHMHILIAYFSIRFRPVRPRRGSGSALAASTATTRRENPGSVDRKDYRSNSIRRP